MAWRKGLTAMKRVIFTAAVVLWMLLIFVFSAQPADASTGVSRSVGHKVGEWFVSGFDDWSQDEQDAFAAKVDYPVRKCAHASEYAMLAILMMVMLGSYGLTGKKRFLTALLGTVFYAATDEFHQLFVPGRSGLATDVLIDAAGGTMGCLIYQLVSVAGTKLFHRRKAVMAFLVIILTVVQAAGSDCPAVIQAKTYRKGFQYTKISSDMKSRMIGKSYPESGAKVSLSSLRAVTVRYYDFKGKKRTGTLVVNKKIAVKVTKIFYELYKIKYPIERIQPVDVYDADDTRSMTANNTSAFNYRRIAGSTKLSKHSQGLAIDINPRINPCVKNGKVEPSNGKAYKTRSVKKCRGKYKKYMIHKNDRVYKIFKKYGFTWGGDWHSLKDYQHFEYAG